jgi:ribosomal protein S4
VTRAYHGDWIQEKKFKRHYLPASLPALAVKSSLKKSRYGNREEKVPLAALMYQELERRLDVAIFRSCFADSVYEARRMVIHGAVKLNGVKVRL